MEDVELIGVSTIGADCYLEPSLSASVKLLIDFLINRYKLHHLTKEVKSISKEWRMHAFFMDALPILNESQTPKRANESNYEAYEDIIQKVNASTEKVTLLFTGPLTDLAKAMCHDQSFLSNVEKLVWMGGTFLIKAMLKNQNTMALQNGMRSGTLKRLNGVR